MVSFNLSPTPCRGKQGLLLLPMQSPRAGGAVCGRGRYVLSPVGISPPLTFRNLDLRKRCVRGACKIEKTLSHQRVTQCRPVNSVFRTRRICRPPRVKRRRSSSKRCAFSWRLNCTSWGESLRRTSRSPEEETNATQEEAPEVSLEEVRERLSTIKGSMAETISDMREDRV